MARERSLKKGVEVNFRVSNLDLILLIKADVGLGARVYSNPGAPESPSVGWRPKMEERTFGCSGGRNRITVELLGILQYEYLSFWYLP